MYRCGEYEAFSVDEEIIKIRDTYEKKRKTLSRRVLLMILIIFILCLVLMILYLGYLVYIRDGEEALQLTLQFSMEQAPI